VTAYQGWLAAALAAFSLGPLGISLWMTSSVLAVIPRKRFRILAGGALLLALLSSGWIPGLALIRRAGAAPDSPVTRGEVFLLGYLHLGLVAGIAIVVFGHRHAPRPPIPPIREATVGDPDRLVMLHRARDPRNPFLKIRGNEVYRLTRRDWEVPIGMGGDALPVDLDGFTILHVSDVHVGDYLVPEYFQAVREEILALPRDVLVFTGDFLDRSAPVAALSPWLEGLGRAGDAFAVLGNHDLHDHDAGEVKAALASAGVRYIGAGTAVVRRGEVQVCLAGIDYQNWWKPFPFAALLREVPEGALPILLAHTPCVFPRAIEAGFPLVLCGHTHGGQVRAGSFGALFIPARYGRRYQMGLYRVGESYLHVHPGIGGPPPLRLCCPPEITRLVLRTKRGRTPS
jgi:predicted MPP superfamily phosphohydrolase